MAHDVFISYSHKDKAVADAICARIEQEGIRCWYAPRDIRPGADWAASIIDAIESAKIMVLVFTDSSNASQQVLREINNAVSAGVVLVPFKLTAALPNRGMQYYLSTVHWLDAMSTSRAQAIENLCGLVRSILRDEQPAGGSNGQTVPPAPVKKPRKWLIPAGILAALAVTGLVLWLCGVFNPGGGGQSGATATPEPALTAEPTDIATEALTEAPTEIPTEAPTEVPTEAPTEVPTETPTEVPTETPTEVPTPTPTEIPTPTPTEVPTATPTPEPTREPTYSTSADDYMYIESGKGITLQKYMGDADVVIIPQEIGGVPVNKIGDECFVNHTEILKVVLPDSLRSFGYKAFYGCAALREINFPDGLYEIGGWSLAHTSVTEAVLPDSVKKLGYGAFYSCNKLTSAVLSPGVVKIDENTFSSCARLKTVTIPAAEVTIDVKAFNEGKNLTIIGVPGSNAEKYAKAMNLKFEAYAEK